MPTMVSYHDLEQSKASDFIKQRKKKRQRQANIVVLSVSINMNASTQVRKFSPSRLLNYWPRLISPVSWWHCFTLLYLPSSYDKDSQDNSTISPARSPWRTCWYIFVHLVLFLLVGLWCYLYWMITFDAGQYLTILSNISSNKSNLTDGRDHFDRIFWRTALKTFFISVDFGLINAFAVTLAALWRQRLCYQFYNLIFRSPNGCVLYETAQQSSYDLPSHLTNDIRQFTSNLSISLFGSLFYSGLIAVGTVVVIFSIYIVQQTDGDTNGIAICFGAFAFCVLMVLLISYRFNRTAVEQLKAKGKIRSFLQRLQTSAECVAFYASSKACELASYLKLNNIVDLWNKRAAIWYAAVNIPLVFMGAVGGFVTYILPALLFFFLRQSKDQTPTEATKYLGIIAFYGYVFWLLSSLIWISEACLIAVTLGDNLWKLRERLRRLNSFHARRLRHDQVAGIKIDSPELIQITKLRIIVPDDDEQRVLQSNINLLAKRGECVLVSGSTGCGKTSLFRICAGLWPIDAESVRLPARTQTIYVPQRPYLPVGSLRFQSLFLLDIRGGRSLTTTIGDQQIRNLFELVHMDYLLDRYDLDSVVDWGSSLSIGEQQRLAFIRLFALFRYRPEESATTLVMLDESTSAIDTTTESVIYELMLELNIWFVTISHRPSLIRYHNKELKLFLPQSANRDHHYSVNDDQDVTLDLSTDPDTTSTRTTDDEEVRERPSIVPGSATPATTMTTSMPEYAEVKKSKCLKDVRDLWKLIHLPFGPNDRALRVQTYVTWILCLCILGCYSYISYRLTVQTGAIFNILPDYAASKTTIAQAQARIRELIWGFVLHIVGLSLLYSAQLGIGQLLGALYTRRQSIYIARALLDDDENEYTLYHSSSLKLLPSIISHDLAEMNTQLFYLLIGSIYYNGFIGVVVNCIPYTILLSEQSGSTKGALIVYLYQLLISLLILCAIRPYYRAGVRFENSFALFSNAQKRIDLQAEQIALSDRGIIDIEHAQLRGKLDASIRAQKHSGCFYGLLVACSVLGNWSSTIINYGIPSVIFFHLTAQPSASGAASIIALTVYTGYLQSNLAVFNSHGQPFSQVWTIGRRIAQNLEQLATIRYSHRELRLAEFSSGRRVELNPRTNFRQLSLALNNVNVCIPTTPSTVLIQSLSFSLNPNASLIITGSSGCGKSSLLRLLAGLQYNLTENSSIFIPPRQAMIFLPQQLYLIEGTLREQLNYFRTAKNMPLWTNDQQLKELLYKFNLLHLVDRYTMDSSVHLWSRTLSLGEQQRLSIVVALVALLKSSRDDSPQTIKYLVLDETTAGCDEVTEKTIYDHLKHCGVQFISISHRHQLVKYHTHQLIIDPKRRSYELVELS